MRYLLLAYHYAWSRGLADFGNEVVDSDKEMTEPEGPDEGEASSGEEAEKKDEAEGPSMKELSVGFLLLTEILSRSMKALFRACMRSICHPCDRPFILTGQFLVFLMCGEGPTTSKMQREKKKKGKGKPQTNVTSSQRFGFGLVLEGAASLPNRAAIRCGGVSRCCHAWHAIQFANRVARSLERGPWRATRGQLRAAQSLE